MAKINNKLKYPLVGVPSLLDYFIGTLALDGSTVNFSIQSILELIDGISGDSINYAFSDGTDPDIDYTTSGAVFTDTNDGQVGSFDKLIFSKNTLSEFNLQQLFAFLGARDDITIKLQDVTNANVFFVFKITAFDEQADYVVFDVVPQSNLYTSELINNTVYNIQWDVLYTEISDIIGLEDELENLALTSNFWISGTSNSAGNNKISPLKRDGTIETIGYIVTDGLGTQFLKADGTLDNNNYALVSALHNPVTIGTANGLSLTDQQLSLGLASSTLNGALSSIDWNIFNGKADMTYVDSQDAAISATMNAHIANVSNPHNTTAILVPATPHLDYLTASTVQEQLDNTETYAGIFYKTDKADEKALHQTGLYRIDTDVSVISVSPANTLNITACNNILFVNEIIPDTPANKIPNYLKSFGNKSWVANATNTPLTAGTRGVFYLGLDKLGTQVYRTSKVYDQDVAYMARIVVENTAGVYSIVLSKYFPDLSNNRPTTRDRLVASSGYIVPSGAASISFGNRGVTFTKNSINYAINKFDPNYLFLTDTVNPTPMQFLFALPNISSIAVNIALSTVINPTQWYTAGGVLGGTAVSGANYQVYKLYVTVTGTLVIQTKASTSNAPAFGINAIFANRDDALAGLTSVVFPEILPLGDSIGLGTFYLRAGTAVNGSQMNDPNDFYFRPFVATSSSSSVGVTAHDLLSGKNDNPTFQHVTTADITNWNQKANDVDVVHKAGVEIITGKKTINALINTTGLAINIPLPDIGSFPDGIAMTTKGTNGGAGFIGAFSVSTIGNSNYGFLFSPDVSGTGNNGFFYSKKLGAAAGNFAFRLRENAATDLFYVNDIGDLFATTAHITSPTGTTLRVEGTGVGGDMAVFTLGAGAANNAAAIYSTTNNSTNNTIAFQGAPKGTRGEAFRGDSSTTIDSILWVRNLAPSHAGVIRVLHGSGGPGVQVETSGTSDDYYAYHGAGATGNPFRYNNNGVDTIRFDYLGGAYFAGNVGIGVNPLAKIHVAGGQVGSDLATSLSNATARFDTANPSKSITFGYVSETANYIQSVQNATSVVVLNLLLNPYGGNVGIGVPIPLVRLSMVGDFMFCNAPALNGSYGKIASRYLGTTGYINSAEIDFIRNENASGNGSDIVFRTSGGGGVVEAVRIVGNGTLVTRPPFAVTSATDTINQTSIMVNSKAVNQSDTDYYPMITAYNSLIGLGYNNQPSFGWMRPNGDLGGSGEAVVQISGDGTPIKRWRFKADGGFYTGGVISSYYGSNQGQVRMGDVAFLDTSFGTYGSFATLKFNLHNGAGYTDIMLVHGNGTIQLPTTGSVAVGGSVVVAGTVTASSDIRLKTNVKPIEKALSKLMKIKGVKFDRNDLDLKNQIGFIAQDLEEVFPELVVTEQSEKAFKSVNYGGMTAVLAQAIKELKYEINQLRDALKL